MKLAKSEFGHKRHQPHSLMLGHILFANEPCWTCCLFMTLFIPFDIIKMLLVFKVSSLYAILNVNPKSQEEMKTTIRNDSFLIYISFY